MKRLGGCEWNCTIKLGDAGKWFIKFIHITPLNEPNLNYESKWASLTFEIK